MERCEGCSIMTDDFVVYHNEEQTIKCKKCYSKLKCLDEYVDFIVSNNYKIKDKFKEHNDLLKKYHLLFDC